jgi:hypothetical protein
VVQRSRDVEQGPLERALEAIGDRPVPAWDPCHFQGPPERTFRYLLVLDTINFSFWGGRGGYRQLARALAAVFAAGDELEWPDRLKGLSADRLGQLIGSFPMMEERAAALRELGRRGFHGLVQPTAAGTARTLARELTSYRDVAEYQGIQVPFLKRAQIVPADLAGAGVASFPDLADLTCFADYKLPQVLRHFGVLRYSERLARRVDNWQELGSGEPAEIEIRAGTVVAVERLRAALAARGRHLHAMQVDWILWEAAQGIYPMRPHHRTRTVFY